MGNQLNVSELEFTCMKICSFDQIESLMPSNIHCAECDINNKYNYNKTMVLKTLLQNLLSQ